MNTALVKTLPASLPGAPPSPEPVSAEVLTRFLARERCARKEAEQLLEVRSRQLYESNLALKNEVERTNVVFETAAEGILIFDGQGRIETLNPAAREIFKLAVDDCKCLNICDLIPSALFCQQGDVCNFDEPLTNLMGSRNEILGQRKDGNTIPLEFVVSKFCHNKDINYSGIVRDLLRRKALEARLAHAQKMESVGQLAAGVAHELNTPIQFVGDNTRFLKSSFESFQKIFGQVNQLLDACDKIEELSGHTQALRSAYQDADFEYLLKEIPQAIDQTLEGTDNVAKIVRAMKVFSHPGALDFQETDLNAALESTLTVSRSEWKYCAEVKKDLAPNLPSVLCMPAELNQTFLNLIVNGAHAIASKSTDFGVLSLRTFLAGDHVVIEIGDTGTGIPPEIQDRVFDPFFTTKGVGRGTGQGLSLCYSVVVEMHGGQISFQSIVGEGTTFRIELPLAPQQS
jgi:two-component system, NtrC family, sensor kinase